MASENAILKEAIAAFMERFKDLKGLDLSYSGQDSPINGREGDATVGLRSGKRKVCYRAEIKLHFSHAARQLLVMQRTSSKRPLLLVARYVNPDMADRLVSDGIEFIDAAGNAFINQGFLKIVSKGNRPKGWAPVPYPRLFKSSGLKVIFALLSRPELVSGTFRDIAKASGVALGSVAGIMDELRARLFLHEDSQGIRRLIRKKDLFESWVTSYPDNLRPKALLGRFRGEHGWWHEKILQPVQAQWGGEVAASRLTDYLNPQEVVIYLAGSRLNDFLLENRLSRDSRGNVEILEMFWTPDAPAHGQETVHPILVYADLLASGSKRNADAAGIIYDQYIARYLGED